VTTTKKPVAELQTGLLFGGFEFKKTGLQAALPSFSFGVGGGLNHHTMCLSQRTRPCGWNNSWKLQLRGRLRWAAAIFERL